MASFLTFLFLLFLAAYIGLNYWLQQRQIKCVAANRGAVPADFAGQVTLEAHQKAAGYTIASIKFDRPHEIVSLAFLLIATLGGLIQWIYDFVYLHIGSGIWGQIFIIGIYSFISALIGLPFSYAHQFKLEEKFGFNKMTKKQFFKDLGISTALGLALGIPLLAVIFWLWDIAGSYWWIWAWAVYALFNILVAWIYPTFIAPLFNKFSPLPEGELKDKIQGLLDRTGFQNKGLFVMDASKRSSKGNAYMTGFGRNKRIVFFDTLISRLSPAEIEGVLAHELGHSKLHHIFKTMAVMLSVSLVMFGVLAWLYTCPWFYEGLGVTLNEGPSQAVALLLFFLVLPVFLFPFSPLTGGLSRKHEFEADNFAAEHADGNALASALVKLFSDNSSTLTPDPVYSAFFASHPEASTRIKNIKAHTQPSA